MRSSSAAARFFRAFQQYSALDQRRTAPKHCTRKYSSRASNHSHGITSTESIATHLKSAMRCMPQPIVVITSRDAARNRTDHGMTISTFTTVCIKPESCVSFSIKRPSHTLDAIESSGSFAVHFLRDSPAAARLAHQFSINSRPFFAGNDKDLVADFGVERSDTPDQLPLIYEKGGYNSDVQERTIYSRMICTYLPQKSISIGDHTVLFAEPKAFNMLDATAKGLAYSHGGYILKPESHRGSTPDNPPQLIDTLGDRAEGS